jgi:hypothetical protein
MPLILLTQRLKELDDTVMSHSGELLLSHAPAAGGYGVAPQIDRQIIFKASFGRRMDESSLPTAPPVTSYSVFTAHGSVVTVLDSLGPVGLTGTTSRGGADWLDTGRCSHGC